MENKKTFIIAKKKIKISNNELISKPYDIIIA